MLVSGSGSSRDFRVSSVASIFANDGRLEISNFLGKYELIGETAHRIPPLSDRVSQLRRRECMAAPGLASGAVSALHTHSYI